MENNKHSLCKIDHPWQGHIEEKVRKLLGSKIKPVFRHFDLTETTDEPGNTHLCLSYVDQLIHVSKHEQLRRLLLEDEGKGGPGTYEKFEILLQNNETLIIVNSYM